MGKFDTLLEFGNSRKGKIVGWGFSLIFALVFFVGLSMTTAGVNPASIQDIRLYSENRFHGTVVDSETAAPRFGWHMTVQDLQTPIRIATVPHIPNAQVRLSTASPLITIRDTTIMAGGSTYIQVNKVGGMFEFHDPDPTRGVDRIVIVVESGNMPTRFIYVRIVLNEHSARVTARLERNLREPDAWAPASSILMPHLDRDPLNPTLNSTFYRARLQFSIFGHVLFDSANLVGREHEYFNITRLGGQFAIGLFFEDPDPFQGGTGLIAVGALPPGAQERIEVINFRISVNYNNQEFVMQPNFSLSIVVPARAPRADTAADT